MRDRRLAFALPALENLESRVVMSATMLEGGVLVLRGSGDADVVVVEAGSVPGQVRVEGIPGVDHGATFEGVTSVRVDLKGGNDDFRVHNSPLALDGSALGCTVRGRDGHDEIRTGSGNDAIYGGRGNDLIVAGAGNDTAFGGYGDDEIYGGDGRDTLVGNANRDRVFGGRGVDSIRGGRGRDFLGGARVELRDLGAEDQGWTPAIDANPEILMPASFWDNLADVEDASGGTLDVQTRRSLLALQNVSAAATPSISAFREEVLALGRRQIARIAQDIEAAITAFVENLPEEPGPEVFEGLLQAIRGALPDSVRGSYDIAITTLGTQARNIGIIMGGIDGIADEDNPIINQLVELTSLGETA